MKPVSIIAISLFVVSLPGQAAALSLESCAAIEHPDERLACYDTLAGRLPAGEAKANHTAQSTVDPAPPEADAVVPAASAVAPAVPAAEPNPDAEDLFGFEHKRKPEEDRPDRLQLKWARKNKDAYGKWIITLENGQVWRQIDSSRFSFTNPEQWVVVSRGSLGSFFMGEPDSTTQIRVKRVK